MALLIASDLQMDMAGRPLLRGVSFKLERRERMTIAGRNGAGKTTLLRILAGELDRPGRALDHGHADGTARPAPAAANGRCRSAPTCAGAADARRMEAELAELERRMGAGETDAAVMRRYAPPSAS